MADRFNATIGLLFSRIRQNPQEGMSSLCGNCSWRLYNVNSAICLMNDVSHDGASIKSAVRYSSKGFV